MSRVHFWQFLINEIGEPIQGAEVSIYLAGTETPAHIYTDEFSGNIISDSPQLTTLSNGFFQAWIGDNLESHGYNTTQKFKLVWEKVGISQGEIDYIDIFPAIKYIEPVDETDQLSIVKDKTVSNQLAFGWEDHITYSIIDDGLPVHGLDIVNSSETDEIPNKLITNKMGWDWDHHQLSTIQSFHPSAGTPHNIEEVDILSSTTIKNKLVSNDIIKTIKDDIYDLSIISASGDSDLNTKIDNLNFQDIFDQSPIDGNDNAGFLLSTGKGFSVYDQTGTDYLSIDPVTGDVHISANLTVSGTTTTINTTELEVADNLITLNSGTVGTPTENAGIEIDRGISATTSLRWNEPNNFWELSNDGTTFYEIHHSGNNTNSSFTISSVSWSSDGVGGYQSDIIHNYNLLYPLITVWDTDANDVLIPNNITSIDANTIRINVSNNSLNLSIRIAK